MAPVLPRRPDGLRFLLLQARQPGDAMALHEQECFAGALDSPLDRLRPVDLLSRLPDTGDLDWADMILVGGSGSFSTLDDEAWIHRFFDFLDRVVVGQGFPTFASCFGFQALVLVGGGEMIKDPPNAEVGTFPITLSEAGQSDPLLKPFSPGFEAQLGHKDRASRLPAGVPNLASSERCPFQAMRLPGLPVFGTQFHPELDLAANIHRYEVYRAGYQGSAADDDDDVLANMRPSPEASQLMLRWVEELQGD